MRGTCWDAQLRIAMTEAGDPGPIVAKAGSDHDWTRVFDAGYGVSNGYPVLAWTPARVYFPVVYDGREWLGSAPRSPTVTGQPHVGGE